MMTQKETGGHGMGARRVGHAVRFEVYKDRQKQYRWRFRGPDGEPVAESSSAHNSKADCLAEIELVRGESPDAEIVDPTGSLDDAEPKPRKRRSSTIVRQSRKENSETKR